MSRTTSAAATVKNSDSKPCIHCGEVKPVTDFYKHPEMRDGHLNSCKVCRKKYVRSNEKKNWAYYQELKRQIRARPYARESARVSSIKYEEKYPERKAVTSTLSHAIRDGKVERYPCWVCGSLKVEGHHPAYDYPLDVIWLCHKHHMQLHREAMELRK